MHTVAELKNSLTGLLSGTDLGNVTDPYGAIQRAARVMIQMADIPEASGRQSYLFYDGVYDNLAPTSLFGTALVDVRPQGTDRNEWDNVYKKQIVAFDQTKHNVPSGAQVTFEYDTGVAIMRVDQNRAAPNVILDPMNNITGWVSSGNASTVILDQTVYYKNPAALRTTLTGAGNGSLTKTLTNAIDLTAYNGVGMVFLALYIPNTPANLSSVQLRIGSSATNYAAVTATAGFISVFRAGKYFLVAFDLSTATNTGTPNFSAINYIDLVFTTGATITNLRVGSLFIALPSPYEILFQSAAIFLASGASIASSTITTDTDTLLLNDAAFTILQFETAIAFLLQNGGSVASPLVASYNQTLHGVRARNGIMAQPGLYDQFRQANPSEVLREVGSYYDN